MLFSILWTDREWLSSRCGGDLYTPPLPLPAIAPRARRELAVTDFTWQVWCEDKMPIFTTITGRDSSRLCSRYITFHHHHLATHKAQRSDVIMYSAANHQLAVQTCNYFSAPGWSLRGRELIWWEVWVLGSGQWVAGTAVFPVSWSSVSVQAWPQHSEAALGVHNGGEEEDAIGSQVSALTWPGRAGQCEDVERESTEGETAMSN